MAYAVYRVTETEYWPSNQVSLRDRRAAKGAVERTYFTDDTRISRMTRDNQSGAQVKNQAYTYDENANRTKDERGTHEYNARDQLTRWTRASTYSHPGTSVTYDLNASGAMLKSTDESLPAGQQQTTYDYTEDQGPGLTFIGDRRNAATDDAVGQVGQSGPGPVPALAGAFPGPLPERPPPPSSDRCGGLPGTPGGTPARLYLTRRRNGETLPAPSFTRTVQRSGALPLPWCDSS